MRQHMPVYMGDQAVEKFIRFSREREDTRFMLVADENTYRALGERVHTAIKDQGWDVLDIVFNPEGLHAENISLARVFARYDGQPRTFVAVGSVPLCPSRPRHPWMRIRPSTRR
jgi:glycerol dehydrogenase-like iron-containing ADH family enzyme